MPKRPVLKETSIGIAVDVLDAINKLQVQNRSALLLAYVDAFLKGPSSTPLFIASLPMRGVIRPVNVKIPKPLLIAYTRSAADLGHVSLSKLFQAALHEHFPIVKQRGVVQAAKAA